MPLSEPLANFLRPLPGSFGGSVVIVTTRFLPLLLRVKILWVKLRSKEESIVVPVIYLRALTSNTKLNPNSMIRCNFGMKSVTT